MIIQNATSLDFDAIFEMYDFAVAFQKTKFYKHWQGFDVQLIENEIAEKINLTGQVKASPALSAWNRSDMKALFIPDGPFGRARIPGKRTVTPSIRPRLENKVMAYSIIALCPP